ncbi:MAG: sulfatase [Victivallaceae bacterium]|nr:sulfatase [Victivallaceae bacterium]
MQKRPNIIWVFGDQHRGQAMSCMGDHNVSTPNLDRMAVEGLHITSALSGCPTCTPFRGALLTSRYPHECAPENGSPLPAGMPTISTVLRENSYYTCYLGKWHLAGEKTGVPGNQRIVPEYQRKDWDEWIGYDNNNQQWKCPVQTGFGKDFKRWYLDGYETDCLTDMLLERIRGWGENQQGNVNADPFFAVLSVQPPHDPSVAPQKFYRAGKIEIRPNVPNIKWVRDFLNKQIKGYYAQVENLDWNLGRIRQTLADYDLDDNTLIFYFSDHGSMLGSHARFNKSVPYEEAIRIPFIIGGAKRLAQLSEDVLLNHVDIAPTTLGFCGIDIPGFMRGFDYSGLWGKRNLDNVPEEALLQECGGLSQIHPEGWRAIVTRDGWKYAVTPDAPWLLFNLNETPDELYNLVYVTHYYQKRRELHNRLQILLDKVNDNFKMPRIFK